MESKNVWQQILGRKNLGSKFFWMKIRGAKWETHFLKEIFLGGIFGSMFWRSRFFWGGNFASKIFGELFASKVIRGKKRILGSKNVLEERYGEQKILRASFYL